VRDHRRRLYFYLGIGTNSIAKIRLPPPRGVVLSRIGRISGFIRNSRHWIYCATILLGKLATLTVLYLCV
jgi:hypothetical protein